MGFLDNRPIVNHWSSDDQVPPSTALSDKISADMRKRGLNFLALQSAMPLWRDGNGH